MKPKKGKAEIKHIKFDSKSVRRTILIFLFFFGFILLLHKGPDIICNDIGNNYDGITKGAVFDITTKTTFYQDFDGAKEVIAGYTIHYTYRLDNKDYIKENFISSDLKSREFVEYARQNFNVYIFTVNSTLQL